MSPTPATPGYALIVDDDQNARGLMREILREAGWDVTEAEHGERALAILRTGPAPRVIILDLMMPVMSGWQFLEERRKDRALAAIPVLVTSAALNAKAELPHVAGYLRKPIVPRLLLAAVDGVRDGQPAIVAESPGEAVEPPAAEAVGPLRVLLVQENDASARLTEAMLGQALDLQLEVRRVRGFEDGGLPGDVPADTDIVLLDPALSGASAVQKMARHVGGVPVVILTAAPSLTARQEFLRRGAQDVLDVERQTPESLGRSLQHAWEVYRLRTELERVREIAAFERERRGLMQLSQPRAAIAAEMLGQTPLKRAAAQRFDAFVADFVSVCERAVAEREHEVSPSQQRKELQKLSDALAALRVGPGDIVDVYQEALPRMTRGKSPEHTQATREEARLMLIGVLGYVLASYRVYVGPETRTGPRT